MDERQPSRRNFLVGSLSGLSAGWLASRWPAILAVQKHIHAAAESALFAKLEFFSPAQAAEIEAVAARIIPSDETPGAREAGAIHFIDRALVTFDRDKQALYKKGLQELEARTHELFPGQTRFSALTPPQQVQLLTAIEKTEFFELVRIHTVMGFLSNPEYGGNRDKAGWRLIGFEDKFFYEPPFGYYDGKGQPRRQRAGDVKGQAEPLESP